LFCSKGSCLSQLLGTSELILCKKEASQASFLLIISALILLAILKPRKLINLKSTVIIFQLFFS